MIRVMIGLGALLGCGLMLVAGALRPPPPRLDARLARISGDEQPEPPAASLVHRLLGHITGWLLAAGGLRVPQQDLAILGMSPQRFVAEKLGAAAAGLLTPTLVVAAAWAVGLRPPWQVPLLAAVLLAAAGWLVPDLTVRSNAARRRSDFRHALSAYFDLVRLAFSSGAGPTQALQQAPHYSGGWAFGQIADAIDAAQHARLAPWQGLSRLGSQIGVDELGDLADLADLAGTEGAKVAAAITAYTQQMRARRLADLRYEAGSRTTTMTVPIAAIGLAFIVLIGFPQVYLLLRN